jgi:hypothetical protein
MGLVDLLKDLAADNPSNPNTPQQTAIWVDRVWFSQPRPGNDPTGEVLTVNFQVPVPISETSIELLRVSGSFEMWYQDRSNNWIQVRDENYQPVVLRLSTSRDVSWYKWHVYLYPIVAKALQVRATRVYDPVLGNQPYNIGLRNGLLRCNIYNRSSGTQAMADEQDTLGNVISKYVQDWKATDAIDDNALTFWRSAPQPSPDAVVSLYLDVRMPDGSPQIIDTLYIDPVYINQNLNIYYSIDDTTGTRTLSPISLPPDFDENTNWVDGAGLQDVSGAGGTSVYQFPVAWGPMVSQDCWIGVEWTPNFDAASGPATNPVLLGVWPGTDAVQTISIDGIATGGTWQYSLDGTNFTANLAENIDGDALQTALEGLAAIGPGNVSVAGEPGGPWTVTFQNALAQQPIATPVLVSALTGGPPTPVVKVAVTQPGSAPPNVGGTQYWPQLYYDVGAGEMTLELTNGSTAVTYSVPLSPVFVKNVPLRIVAAWAYDPQPTVFLSVQLPNGTVLGTSTTNPSDLPTHVSLDGEVGYLNFAGTMSATVIKLENYAENYPAFMANPEIYVNPNPVQPDPNSGIVPSTTLDNAIFAVDWTLQDVGYGGGHSSFYTNKTWTPIFANYVTQKGKLYFPQPVMAKYLQLEFSNLTEESYPVYDSGIAVRYQTFPLSVTAQARAVPPSVIASGALAINGQIQTGGIGSVNWLNASTITMATTSIFGMAVPPQPVSSGTAVTAGGSLPNTLGSDASATAVEVATPWVYRRQIPNTDVLASQLVALLTQAGAGAASGIQTLAPYTNSTSPIGATMAPSITFSPSSTALPLQGTDYWVVPGQTLALAANVMTGLTQGTQVQLNRKPSTDYRLRFNTTCTHQYTTKTIVRDAAIAYFAGLREVSAFVTNYIAHQDPPKFVFSPYDPNSWSFDANITQLPTGPISTKGLTYQIQNPLFDTSLVHWTPTQGAWSLDAGMGRWQYGSATVTADGTEKILLSDEVTAWPEVTPGANFQVTVEAQWQNLTINTSTSPLQLQANFYLGDTFVSQQVASLAPTGATNMWDTGGQGGQTITGSFTTPNSVDTIKLALVVTPDATAGQVWYDTVVINSTDTVEATTYIDLITQSTFNKVNCIFTDSGLVRSDSMWANIDPNNTNISSTQLSYYVSTIPSNIPSGTWGDTIAKWGDSNITWGEPFAVVAINVDPNMTYNNKRVLHFSRAAGAGEAGIQVRVTTNFVANGLFRIGAIYFYPKATGNQITLRLRRVSDGVFIYEETITPVAGYWFEYQTHFQEIPDSNDQIYEVEFTLSGDAADQIYLNDLYVDVAHIRYYCRLGGSGAFLHDVTELRYTDTSIVSATTPVNEALVQAVILSPTAYAYGATLVPNYLK